jgi:hypothetical protein
MSASHADALASMMSMSSEDMAAVHATMPPEMCAPTAAYLAHESCRLTGEVLQAGMGGVSRLAIVHSAGIAMEPLSTEDVAEHLGSILDLEGATVPETTPIHG